MGLPSTVARNPGATTQRLLTGIGAGILLSLSSATGAYAFDERVTDLIEHFVECKILLLTDQEAHAENCLPNTVPPFFGTLAPVGSDGPPQQITPAPVDPEPGDECEESEECCEFKDSRCERA